MNNLKTNALRIAELLDYDEWRLNNIQDVLICRYTAYDYLMPIVFESKKSKKHTINILAVSVVFGGYDSMNEFETIHGKSFETEPEFIEAIQLACIKYLELKNDN